MPTASDGYPWDVGRTPDEFAFLAAFRALADPTLQMTEARMPLDQPGLFRVEGPLSASSAAAMAWRWLERRLAEP